MHVSPIYILFDHYQVRIQQIPSGGFDSVFLFFLLINVWAPRVLRGSGENGYFFTGSWGALVINLGNLGSKLIVLRIKGALLKS